MEATITAIAAMIPEGSLPIVVCILGLAYIYWKINSQRKVTKTERDTAHDDLDKRLTLVEHDISFMKQQHSLFADKLDKILNELCNIKIELAKKEEKK